MPKKLKIMIIEDEACVRETLIWYLEESGHMVFANVLPVDCEVFKGEMCNKNVPCFDALIIDQFLPKLKGLDFVKSLVERDCKVNCENILLVSGSFSNDLEEGAKDLGISFKCKPVTFDFVSDWISNIDVLSS